MTVKVHDRRWLAARIALLVAAGIALGLTIDRPFTGMHSWRQTHNAMVARNFVRHSWNPSLTLVDFGGGELLYAANLPVLSYPTAVIWRIAGAEPPAAPRGLAILATLLAALYLARLARRLGGELAGLASILLFIQIPLVMGYGTAFLDDSVLLAALGGAVFHAHAYGRDRRTRDALFVALWLGLAIAIKPPAIFALLPVGAAAWVGLDGGSPRRMVPLAGAAAAAIALGFVWYAVLWWRVSSYPNVLMSFGVSPGTDKWGNLTLLADPGTWTLLGKRLTQEVTGFTGVALVALGLWSARRRREVLVPLAWLGAVVVYVVVVIGGHREHDYYQLVLAQPAALAMALAFGAARRGVEGTPGRRPPAWLLPALAVLLTTAAVVELRPFRSFLVHHQDLRWEQLAADLAAETDPDDRVLVIDHSLPEILYLADRRGFHLRPEQASPEALDDRLAAGVSAIAVLEPQRLLDSGHEGLWSLHRRWCVVRAGEHHAVFTPCATAERR